MADVRRSEVLAASRSRTGWLDEPPPASASPTSPAKPFISSLRSTFESRSSQPQDGSERRRLVPGSSKTGSKVSSIANMFQARDENKTASTESLTRTSPLEPNPADAARPSGPPTLTRSDSHVARFYNARAMFERLQEASKKPQPAATPGRKGSVGSSPASSPSSTAPPTSSPRWSDHVVLEETVKPLVNGDSHSARNSTAGGAGEQRNIHPESAIANGMGRQDTAAAAITQALEPNILEGEPPPPVKVPQHKKPSAPPRVESLRRSSEEGPLPAEPQQPEALKESRPVPSGAEGPGKEHSAEVVQELKLALSSARSSSSCSLDSGAGESRVFENNADRFEVAPYTECVLGASNKVSKTRSTDAVLLPEDAESHQHVNIGGLAAEELEWKAEDDGENERAKHSSSITFGRLGSTKPPLPSKLPVLDQISSRHNSGKYPFYCFVKFLVLTVLLLMPGNKDI